MFTSRAMSALASVRAGHTARRAVSIGALGALVVGSMVALAPAATADPSPIGSRPATAVTADALPTVQIDGVAWSQAIVGNTVYVGGKFTNARPAGAAAGTNLTPRANLLSYDITTGTLNTAWNPGTNGDVRAVAASPDGSRVYVGGTFTTAGGANRYRVAAFNTATGALVANFAPVMSTQVNALVATNSTLYVGGQFTTANGVQRNRLAAFSTSNGALLGWAPDADFNVNALALTPDGSRVIVGGAFANINGGSVYGLGAIDATTGAVIPWAANQSVQNAGKNAAITSLTTDGTSIIGTGYVFGAGGNLEGAFSADPNSGAIRWVEDCHGDTYSAYSDGTTVYTTSHAHYCSTVGGFPQTDQDWSINQRHLLAFSASPTGTLGHNVYGGYKDWYGTPSPTLLNWFPELKFGNFTAQAQAAWSLTGNGRYLAVGGEFPSANGTPQQGLVRFANPSAAPKLQGPLYKNSAFVPNLVSLGSGSVRVAFQSNLDRDDQTLTYQVFRDGATKPIWTKTANSQFWNRPMLGFTDSGLAPGSTHTYRVYASDPDGNLVKGDTASVTLPNAPPSSSAYAATVLGDGASNYWRLGESAAGKSYDYAGFDDLTVNSGVSRGAAGAITNDTDAASTFDGSNNGFAVDPTAAPGPNTFTTEAWFKTTSTSGGKIIGYGDKTTGTSGNYDRHVYMDRSGKVWFGVYNGASYTVNTSASYNDGQWHQVVATMSSSGLVLYLDGKRIGSNGGTSIGQSYTGYWRIGGDSSWSGSNFFQGAIDDVAIYPTPLSLSQVQNHYVKSGRTLDIPSAPTDSYGAAVYKSTPDVYWRLDDANGPTAADTSINSVPGVYSGGVNYNTSSPVSGSTGSAVTFTGDNGTIASSTAYQDPTTYSEELWFNTTTGNGGKLIGFGDQQSGQSNSYDRHVFMNNNGSLTFGTYTGQLNEAVSPLSYNDGKWHHMIATQGAAGMRLYVDGSLVATNSQTGAQSYTGYWRVGGDTAWDGVQPWFNGSIDEAAVYLTELTPAQVSAHYRASPAAANVKPTASFTSNANFLTASFDASASTDVDGTIASYAWDFGDRTTGSGVSPNHTYAASGTYPVTLTVTDDHGATGTTSADVTVTKKPNVGPAAAFTYTVNDLAVGFDGSTSSDSDGTVASYSWNFGDGTPAGSGATPIHTYAAAGSYPVALTVTDNDGGTNTISRTVAAVAPNQLPTAAFTSTKSNLSAAFDGSSSSDSDGSIASYSWNFGDGTSAGSGVTPSHDYAAAGTYQVSLTVTDNRGGTNTVTQPITVTAPANQAPTAAFTSSINNLAVTFDATSSSDPDGSVAGYKWDFGDTTGTSAQSKPTYTYAAAGTYTVSLTVTDDKGARTTTTHDVTVVAPAAGFAVDQFGRTVTSGWGSADVGGPWTLSGSASSFSVGNGTGQINLKAGSSPAAYLNAVSKADVNATVTTSMTQLANGGGAYSFLAARRSTDGTSLYRLKTWVNASGAVQLIITKVLNGSETVLRTYTVPGLTYAPGDKLKTRFVVTGSGTAGLAGKVWKTSATEPASAQISASDASALPAGGVGVTAYLSASSTSAPASLSFDDLSVTAP